MILNTDMDSKDTFFSIVVPTGNRPQDLMIALDGIQQQKYQHYEVIIVNNGTKPEFICDYNEIEKHFDKRFKFLNFHNDFSQGFGPAIARNIGIQAAKGEYVTFCDDDDKWIDCNYLSLLNGHIQEANPVIVISEQQGIEFLNGKEVIARPKWFKDIKAPEYSSLVSPKLYLINFDYFIATGALPHLNTTVYRKKELLNQAGFDRSLWYEEDLDLFLRMAAANHDVYFNDLLVASHYIPDKAKNINITSNIDTIKTNQIRVLIANKLLTNQPNVGIEKYAQQLLMNSSKHITEYFDSKKMYRFAIGYAKLALSMKFTPKWFAYSLYLFIKSKISFRKDC